ncbi:MAG: HAD family hydrolase [Methanomassiliicoccales archaeon]|nr:HAD family hydrolase [Methanomassiliicoccales archaeon]
MKAVIFDLGHTLINYHNDWKGPEAKAVASVSALVREASQNGADERRVSSYLFSLLEKGRERKLREMVEIPLEDVLRICFENFSCAGDENLMRASLEAFYNVLLERRELVPGTKEMLRSLRDRGFRIGLVSDVAWGLPSYFPQKDMRHFGLEKCFDDMVFSTDVGLRKPNPRIFRMALSNIESSPRESYFVGNSLQADIKGALDVGMTAVLKESDYFTPDDNIVPDARISNWDELRVLIEERE